MRKLVALAGAIALVFALSAGPANAQSVFTPPVVVDRTAVTLTYQPFPVAAGSTFDVAVSYQFGPGPWDLLFSYASPSGGAGTVTAYRIGGRYHVRPPSSGWDTYVTLQYYSPSTGSTHFELGAGLTQPLAPGLKSYGVLTYVSALPNTSANPYIAWNVGVQYEITRQFDLVLGYEGFQGLGYLGINWDFTAR